MASNDTNISGYYDGMIWGKKEEEENAEETIKRFGFFPTTRYNAILNRPRVIEDANVVDTPNTPYSFVVTDVVEVSDDDIYALFKQAW